MKVKKFCANCGHSLKITDSFCPKCGIKIVNKKLNKNVSSDDKPAKPISRQALHHQKDKRPIPKKKKVALLVSAVVVVILAGLGIWGKNYYSEENQINRMAIALTDSRKNAAKYLITDNKNIKINKESVAPYKKLFKYSNVENLKYDLKNYGSIKSGQLIENGRYFLIFPKYQIKVASYSPTVETNHEGSTLYVNNKNMGRFSAADENYVKKVTDLLAGEYVFTVTSPVSGRVLKSSSTERASNSTIDMSIQTQIFTVKGPAHSKIYINDNNAGTLDKNGEKTFNNYPVSKEMNLYLTTNVNKKTLKSSKIENLGEALVGDSDANGQVSNDNGDIVVSPIWKGVATEEDAKDLIQNAYESPDSESFVNGTSNSGYNEIVKMEKGFEKMKKTTVLITKLKLNHFRQVLTTQLL